MKHNIIVRFLKWLLRLEHILYCATGCRVELGIHRGYYRARKEKYNQYLDRKVFWREQFNQDYRPLSYDRYL